MPSLGFTIATAAAVQQVILRPYRAIVGKPLDVDGNPLPDETIVADAVVSEMHVDDLNITDHPVEQGADITDHAYRKPTTLVMTYGWAAASPNAIRAANIVATPSPFVDPDFLRGVYEAVRRLQRNRTFCEVFTGKRYYPRMLVQSCSYDNRKETERALILRLTLREVLIARTRTTVVPANGVMDDPASTGGVSDRGPKLLGPTKTLDGPIP